MGIIVGVESVGGWLTNIPYRLGLLLLAAQLGALVTSCFTFNPFFSWPHHTQEFGYLIGVSIGGEGLHPLQVERRYRRPPEGIRYESPEILFDLITRTEKKLEPTGRSKVTVSYNSNGGPERLWHYPPQ